MKVFKIFLTFSLVISLCCFFACDGSSDGDANQSCDPGATQTCYFPDGSSGEKVCNEDGASWTGCEGTTYSIWCDKASDLCWQDPQKDAFNKENGGVTSYDAERYCDELVLGGYDDWRLPNIMELRSIIEGNNFSEDGGLGLCSVDEGSLINSHEEMESFGLLHLVPGMTNMIPCMGRMTSQLEGKDESGCYWKEELSGSCNRVDPASPSHNLEFWSSTKAADDPENWQAYVFFDFAAVGFNHSESFGEVRCVRDAPSPVIGGPLADCAPGTTDQCECANGKTGARVCSKGGNSYSPCDCTGFTTTPGPEDVADQCDQITLKVSLSSELDQQPYLLAAFLYKTGEVFMRPPDVGSYENGLLYPDISMDKPVTMTIPGCSYYRDRCMSGYYYLVVYLKMNEGIFPGMPQLVDQVWMNFDTIELAGDGSKNYNFEVEVVPMLLSPVYMLFDW